MFINNTKLIFQPVAQIGDMFVFTGIINWIADRCTTLFVPIYNNPTLIETAACLFRENNRIHPFIYNDNVRYSDINHFINNARLTPCRHHVPLIVQTGATTFSDVLGDEQAYTTFDLPYSLKYRNFRLPDIKAESKQLYDKLVRNDKYIVLSNSFSGHTNTIDLNLSARKSNIPLSEYQIIEINDSTKHITNNILLYTEILKNASEIHCVPTSIFCLTDILNEQIPGDLYYHNIRGGTVLRVNNQWNNDRWTKVEYDYRL